MPIYTNFAPRRNPTTTAKKEPSNPSPGRNSDPRQLDLFDWRKQDAFAKLDENIALVLAKAVRK